MGLVLPIGAITGAFAPGPVLAAIALLAVALLLFGFTLVGGRSPSARRQAEAELAILDAIDDVAGQVLNAGAARLQEISDPLSTRGSLRFGLTPADLDACPVRLAAKPGEVVLRLGSSGLEARFDSGSEHGLRELRLCLAAVIAGRCRKELREVEAHRRFSGRVEKRTEHSVLLRTEAGERRIGCGHETAGGQSWRGERTFARYRPAKACSTRAPDALFDVDDIYCLDEWRGRLVFDRDGRPIGGLSDVYFDQQTGEPSFASVQTGLRRCSLVPLAGASVLGGLELRVAHDKARGKRAPSPSGDGSITSQEELQLLRHYELERSNATPIEPRKLVRYRTIDRRVRDIRERAEGLTRRAEALNNFQIRQGAASSWVRLVDRDAVTRTSSWPQAGSGPSGEGQTTATTWSDLERRLESTELRLDRLERSPASNDRQDARWRRPPAS